MDDLIRTFLELLNETLSAAIVIVAASMLLYNVTRNLRNRVARTSGAVLACVTVVYISEVLITLGPGIGTFELLLRLKWVGLAFIPAAMFHLSDALLATTGLPSRGRRRLVVRILYAVGAGFMLLAAFTDLLVTGVAVDNRISLEMAPFFGLYLAYFILINAIAFNNVRRAQQRCLLRSTERRMTYLLAAIPLPIIGIFPYSVLLEPGDEFTIFALVLVNLANLMMVFTLVFLSYPLSFFGSQVPDRVVKAELMRFMLRGPATGLLALVMILFAGPTIQLLGMPGDAFMPFAVVAVILLWQWVVALALPWLERVLIYHNEDDEQLVKLQNLGDRLLTRSDLVQLIEANLEAICDYLRIQRAFVVALANDRPELVKAVGRAEMSDDALQDEIPRLALELAHDETNWTRWEAYRLMPLYSRRIGGDEDTLIGMIGVENREDAPLTDDDKALLVGLIRRTARTLDDILLQGEVYAALEGLLPQFTLTRERAAEVEYRPGRTPRSATEISLPDREQVIEQVRAALRHYYGGPGMSSSRLLEFQVVHDALPENEDNPVRALRTVLLKAIENQSPDGTRDLKSPEWTLYNILHLRFIEQRKVRETAARLYMSEANLYRKQNVAIEAVADTLLKMEYEALNGNETVAPRSDLGG